VSEGTNRNRKGEKKRKEKYKDDLKILESTIAICPLEISCSKINLHARE